jgi:hypothetical protein
MVLGYVCGGYALSLEPPVLSSISLLFIFIIILIISRLFLSFEVSVTIQLEQKGLRVTNIGTIEGILIVQEQGGKGRATKLRVQLDALLEHLGMNLFECIHKGLFDHLILHFLELPPIDGLWALQVALEVNLSQDVEEVLSKQRRIFGCDVLSDFMSEVSVSITDEVKLEGDSAEREIVWIRIESFLAGLLGTVCSHPWLG